MVFRTICVVQWYTSLPFFHPLAVAHIDPRNIVMTCYVVFWMWASLPRGVFHRKRIFLPVFHQLSAENLFRPLCLLERVASRRRLRFYLLSACSPLLDHKSIVIKRTRLVQDLHLHIPK